MSTGLLDLSVLTREVDVAFIAFLYELFGSAVVDAEQALTARTLLRRKSERIGMQLLAEANSNRPVQRLARERLVLRIQTLRDDVQRGLTQAWLSADGQPVEARVEFMRREIVPRLVMDAMRTWARVGTAEIWTLYQETRAQEIIDSTGLPDPYVQKTGAEDCCEFCVHLYGSEGKYKTFRLSELRANGTNAGREPRLEVLEGKVVPEQHRDWLPVLGSTHGWCNCALQATGAST